MSSTTDRILLTADESPLLARLLRLLPSTVTLLADDAAWSAFDVDGRVRLVCRELLVDGGRRYRLALHRFTVVGARTALHDHRYPLAVFPFAAARATGPLYDMPWQHRVDGVVVDEGVVAVVDGRSWAIEAPTAIWHAVQSRAPHASVLLSDVTAGPLREQRLTAEKLGGLRRRLARHRLRGELAAALKRDAVQQGVSHRADAG